MVLLNGLLGTINVLIMVIIGWSGEHSLIKLFYRCEIHGILLVVSVFCPLPPVTDVLARTHTHTRTRPSGELSLLGRITGGCIVIPLKNHP